MAEHTADVFISGAGPVGLVLAYLFTRLGHSVYIIDAADKSDEDFPMYGRASTLHARTLELLDQVDLLDDLLQVGFVGNAGFAYRDGKLLQGRGWKPLTSLMGQTNLPFSLNIRLKYSEDVFRDKLAQMGVVVHAPMRLRTFELDNTKDYAIRAECLDTNNDSEVAVKAKYIIGADGGNSTVRKVAKIPFIGERHVQHWVRIDGVVRTNVPEAREGFGTFESSTHGHVLWVTLDHGATRIGYVLSEELYEKYGTGMSAADAVAEAKKAVAPFELEFDEVHWHTVYGIQQHVAKRFQDRQRVLLAGEAAHTHSSSSAQGMNTGMFDATALAWRLSGVLKGWYRPEVLALYSDERRQSSQHLISVDKLLSELMSGRIPDSMKGQGNDPMTLVDQVLKEQGSFTVGLGITYPPNLLNDVEGSTQPIRPLPGHRFPDCNVYKNGEPKHPVRLYQVTKYNGKFKILMFAGVAAETRGKLQQLRKAIDQHAGRFDHAVDQLTIIAGYARAFDEHLGVPRFGRAYWDIDHSAHQELGIFTSQGALVVLRPDGMLGHTAPLTDYGRAMQYLERLIGPHEPQETPRKRSANKKGLGEFLGENENALSAKSML